MARSRFSLPFRGSLAGLLTAAAATTAMGDDVEGVVRIRSQQPAQDVVVRGQSPSPVLGLRPAANKSAPVTQVSNEGQPGSQYPTVYGQRETTPFDKYPVSMVGNETSPTPVESTDTKALPATPAQTSAPVAYYECPEECERVRLRDRLKCRQIDRQLNRESHHSHLKQIVHDDCEEKFNWFRCKFGFFFPNGSCGKGTPLVGHYSMVYPVNPNYHDPRDSQIYAAQGHNGPVAVPLAPVVHHQFNYGWGVPSSRLTPVSHPVYPGYGY